MRVAAADTITFARFVITNFLSPSPQFTSKSVSICIQRYQIKLINAHVMNVEKRTQRHHVNFINRRKIWFEQTSSMTTTQLFQKPIKVSVYNLISLCRRLDSTYTNQLQRVCVDGPAHLCANNTENNDESLLAL